MEKLLRPIFLARGLPYIPLTPPLPRAGEGKGEGVNGPLIENWKMQIENLT